MFLLNESRMRREECRKRSPAREEDMTSGGVEWSGEERLLRSIDGGGSVSESEVSDVGWGSGFFPPTAGVYLRCAKAPSRELRIGRYSLLD